MRLFNGPDYQPERDDDRLTGQLYSIFNLMKDGKWRTLTEISKRTGAPQSSVSAQLRHLRKDRFGGHTVNKQYLGDGLYSYQLEIAESANSGANAA